MSTKARDLKQGAMQKLLTGKDSVDRFENNSTLTQTEIGAIPKDWDLIQLELLADVRMEPTNRQSTLRTEFL